MIHGIEVSSAMALSAIVMLKDIEMGYLCIAATLAASAIQGAPDKVIRSVNGQRGVPMPDIGIAPPPGTLMLGLTVSPAVKGSPMIYRLGSPLKARLFADGYASSAISAGYRVMRSNDGRVTGVLKNGTSFHLEVVRSGLGSVGILTMRPASRRLL